MFKIAEGGRDGHVRDEVRALAERAEPISKSEWESLRLNSYELELLLHRLDDEAIVGYAGVVLSNCAYDRRRPFVSYNDAAMGLLCPELLRRIHVARGAADTSRTLAEAERAYGQAKLEDFAQGTAGWSTDARERALEALRRASEALREAGGEPW